MAISDIDIAHGVPTRYERTGPKPVICNLFRRLAKDKVMEVRQQASQINPTRIGLSAGCELGRVRLFNHLTPAKQELFSKAKKFKDENRYRFLPGQELHRYLRKAEGSPPRIENIKAKLFTEASERSVTLQH